MDRARFLFSAAAGALGAMTMPLQKARGGLLGHVTMDHPVALRIAKVFVDGVETTRVFEFDDDKGWARRYTELRLNENGQIPVEKVYGKITVEWR